MNPQKKNNDALINPFFSNRDDSNKVITTDPYIAVVPGDTTQTDDFQDIDTEPSIEPTIDYTQYQGQGDTYRQDQTVTSIPHLTPYIQKSSGFGVPPFDFKLDAGGYGLPSPIKRSKVGSKRRKYPIFTAEQFVNVKRSSKKSKGKYI